jgi:hypothetical protein
MPKVGKKTFPYTKAGMKDAKMAAKHEKSEMKKEYGSKGMKPSSYPSKKKVTK